MALETVGQRENIPDFNDLFCNHRSSVDDHVSPGESIDGGRLNMPPKPCSREAMYLSLFMNGIIVLDVEHRYLSGAGKCSRRERSSAPGPCFIKL
ncbi:hypothetical protein OE88DRAFT_1661024 [Heliocybe sulcata]|uniref:Uncharacterized protein n=1 Tax=Heliocybe sulcata TaxID=5364 RepID=A0A5C3N2A5_9AGAM|nr:hypothetical protein OE88DRAFT_1661024 [Heliocybe sulcata]